MTRASVGSGTGPIVIVKLMCGLGNQLFQYAMGRRLAVHHGVPLKLDLRDFLNPLQVPGLEMYARSYRLGDFNIKADVATNEEVERLTPRPLRRCDPRRIRGPYWRLRRRFPRFCRGMFIMSETMNFEPGLLELPPDVYLDGWWQSESYFKEIRDVLQREFTLRDASITARAAARVREFRNNGKPLVAVHVRRGDVARAYEVLKDISNVANVLLPASYFMKAMSDFDSGQATFLVFSESAADLDWCRANIPGEDVHYVQGESDLDDFEMMRLCDHNIISSSSFGWWAAWLNENPQKVVIAPRTWFRPGFADDHDIRSIIPPEWHLR